MTLYYFIVVVIIIIIIILLLLLLSLLLLSSSSSYFMFILGKLCDASARYERAIQEEPNEIGHHKVTVCNVSSFM